MQPTDVMQVVIRIAEPGNAGLKRRAFANELRELAEFIESGPGYRLPSCGGSLTETAQVAYSFDQDSADLTAGAGVTGSPSSVQIYDKNFMEYLVDVW